jgi:hypothetical protein
MNFFGYEIMVKSDEEYYMFGAATGFYDQTLGGILYSDIGYIATNYSSFNHYLNYADISAQAVSFSNIDRESFLNFYVT